MSTSRATKIALIQLAVSASKSDNFARALTSVNKAAAKGAKIVILPECFNSPYGTQYFKEYAEKIPGESTSMLSHAAKTNKVFLVGGSIPEEDKGHLYNTCTVYNPEGEMIAKHRKVHLFDIDVPGKISFKESDVLCPGSRYTMFNTPFCKVGIGICYDIRFPELAQVYAKEGCELLVYPGAFNMTTGPAHWELLQRSRALDNQLYVAAVSPARDESASYVAWGHSSLVDPWAKIVATAGHEEDIVIADIDMEYLEKIRQQVPVSKQKRHDMYQVNSKTG